MIVGRIAGWVLLLGALAAAAAELLHWLSNGAWRALSLGELWREFHANSLIGFGRIIETYLSEALWTGVLVPLLSLPTWLVLGLPGVLLAFVFRHRKRRRRFRRG